MAPQTLSCATGRRRFCSKGGRCDDTLPAAAKSPGDWLTVFREQVECEDGRPFTPERLGALIGYSGSTVRRWESDRYVPPAEAVAPLAAIRCLSRLQTAF